MPLLAALLAWFARYGLVLILENLGKFVVKAFTVYGVSVVVHKYAVQPAVQYILGVLSGVPASALQALSGVAFDQAITIVLSAHALVAANRVRLEKSQQSSGSSS